MPNCELKWEIEISTSESHKVKRHKDFGRRLAAFFIATLLAVMALPLLSPTAVRAVAQPSNVSPEDGTTDISLTPTLRSSDFFDAEGDTHTASQWQITTTSGDYSSPVFDSGIDPTNLTQISIPADLLEHGTTYYWHVRHQDDIGWWSLWSTETNFTTIATQPPNTPSNLHPSDGAVDIILTPTLRSSAFSDPDEGDTHAASQWQITVTSGDYSSPVFDSGIDTSNLTQIAIVSGTLSYNTTYYWHVRYQDNCGKWSAYSTETSFTTIANLPPNQPGNTSPVNGATDISLTPALESSAFSDPDAEDTHAASQWQIREDTAPTDYSVTVFHSDTDTANLTEVTIPSETLTYNTTYYWHVRYQDSYGNWSGYSSETSFTTVASLPPDQPTNSSPSHAATNITLTPTLRSSAFSDLDPGDTHAASEWQITTTSGDYSSPVFDSGVDTTNLTQIALPSETLTYNTTYYWHVRHEDSYGNWSSWSTETSFTTIAMQPPVTPSNSSPANAATDISVTPTLTSSAFSDPNVGDTHAASQWQITTTSGDYSSPVYDSDTDSSNLTQITIPSGTLSYNTTYYWQVRHQDSYGDWSEWSTETSFATMASQADFSATPTQAVEGETITFTDLSTGGVTSWIWDFGDGTTAEWTTETRPEDGKLTHAYSTEGSYTVSLAVSGPAGEDTMTEAAYITVSAAAGAGLPWVWIIGIGLAVIVGLFILIRIWA